MKSVLTFLFAIGVVLIAVTTVKASAVDVNEVERLINEKEYDVALDLLYALPTVADQPVIWQEQLQDSINILEDESVSHQEKQLTIQKLVVLSDSLEHGYAPLWLRHQQAFERKTQQLLQQEEIHPAEIERLVDQTELLAPVIQLQLTDTQYQNYQDVVTRLKKQQTIMDHEQFQAVFGQMKQWHALTIKQTNASQTKWLIFTLVSAYLVSFSYVAWKRSRVRQM
ncbi:MULTISPECIES: sporulation protein YpjB [Gracilibacillus]|uniref:sporulation protein YpjB n=1 Tax=Gracilibacillus TaxID=74385 RepID=UPI000825E8D8|nr:MULTISPECIES: sporulation protein YpjB [Gracilibacillus]